METYIRNQRSCTDNKEAQQYLTKTNKYSRRKYPQEMEETSTLCRSGYRAGGGKAQYKMLAPITPIKQIVKNQFAVLFGVTPIGFRGGRIKRMTPVYTNPRRKFESFTYNGIIEYEAMKLNQIASSGSVFPRRSMGSNGNRMVFS